MASSKEIQEQIARLESQPEKTMAEPAKSQYQITSRQTLVQLEIALQLARLVELIEKEVSDEIVNFTSMS